MRLGFIALAVLGLLSVPRWDTDAANQEGGEIEWRAVLGPSHHSTSSRTLNICISTIFLPDFHLKNQHTLISNFFLHFQQNIF